MVFDIDCKSGKIFTLRSNAGRSKQWYDFFLKKSTRPLNFTILVTIYKFLARKREPRRCPLHLPFNMCYRVFVKLSPHQIW